MDPATLKALQAKYGSLMPDMTPQAPQKTRGRGGTATSLISEGGALGGAAIGAGIGSVVPVLGTAIGGIIGAGVGAFGGRLAENRVRDDRWGGGDALKEGALSAVLSGPLKLGKYALSAGKAAKGGAGLATALSGAADDAAKFSIRGALGGRLSGASDDLVMKSFRFTPSQLKNYKKKFGEDALETIKRYGFKTPEDIAAKGIAPLKGQYDEALKSIDQNIGFDEFAGAVEKRAAKLIESAPQDKQQQGLAMLDELNAMRQQYGKGGFTNGAALNQLKDEFDDLVNYSQKAANPNKYTVNKRIADSARDVLYSRSPALEKTGLEMNRLIQLSDNALGQRQLGRGNLPIGIGNLPLTVAGAGAGGPGGAAAGYVTNAIINSRAGRQALASGTGALGGKLTSQAAKSGPVRQVAGGLARAEGARGLMAALSQSEGNNMDASAMTMPQPINDNIIDPASADLADPSMTTALEGVDNSGPDPNDPFNPANVRQNVQKIVTNGGTTKDVKEYISLVEALQSIDAAAAPTAAKPLNSTSAQTVADLQNGIINLKELSAQVGSSNANTPFIGALRAKNPFDNEAQNLQANIARTKQVIGKALEGGVLRKEDELKYAKILPTLNDTDQVAQQKIDYIAADLQRKLFFYEQGIGQGGGGQMTAPQTAL